MFLFEKVVNHGGYILVDFRGNDLSQLVSLKGKRLAQTQKYVVHLSTNDSIYILWFHLQIIKIFFNLFYIIFLLELIRLKIFGFFNPISSTFQLETYRFGFRSSIRTCLLHSLYKFFNSNMFFFTSSNSSIKLSFDKDDNSISPITFNSSKKLYLQTSKRGNLVFGFIKFPNFTGEFS